MNRQLFKIKGYLPLLSAQIISNLGDWLDILALLALIGMKWQASPFAVSVAMFCLAVPSIVFGSFAGVLADRFDRKTLMIIADLVRAAAVIGIAFSTALWQVYLLLIVKSIFGIIFNPAESGKIKEMVPENLMQSAVATRELVNNGAKIIGPMISGVLVASVGIQWSFYLDSLSFLLSAAFLLGLPGRRREQSTLDNGPASKTARKSFFEQFTEGLSLIKQSPKLLVGLIVFSLTLLVLQISDSQIVILIREIKQSPVSILGWIMAGSGAGMIAVALFLGKKQIRAYFSALSIGCVGVGFGYILLGLLIHLPFLWMAIAYPVIAFIAGGSFAFVMIPFDVMAQKLTPVTHTGRVFGTIGSVTTTATVIGMLSGGLITEAFNVIFTFVFAGGLLVLVGIVVSSCRRRLESGDDEAKSVEGTLRKKEG
ncbi:MFS transporter [Camelliibacillus cellulosilyticus]|uniref:MFS transporter n=1 Tax=Camelliibacillus cellulosilyticus TaxID=2174486 RepID=A0ABV9GJ46_9BACL